MFEKLFDRIEAYVRKNDPAYKIRKSEEAAYQALMKDLTEEAAYFLKRPVSEEDILNLGRKENNERP